MKGKYFDVAYNIDNWLNYMYIIQKQKAHKTVFFVQYVFINWQKKQGAPTMLVKNEDSKT